MTMENIGEPKSAAGLIHFDSYPQNKVKRIDRIRKDIPIYQIKNLNIN
jgi:hypothetical protein